MIALSVVKRIYFGFKFAVAMPREAAIVRENCEREYSEQGGAPSRALARGSRRKFASIRGRA
jgi:hypothetical protein